MTENEAPDSGTDKQDEVEDDAALDEQDPEELEQDVDEVEQELLDAMRSLSRKNRKIEEYLDGLARSTEKPQQEEPAQPAE